VEWSDHDRRFMARALQLAAQAAEVGEVPVGAVLVRDGRVVGEGANAPISACDPTAHAEILALRQAAAGEANYRLPGSALYVSLEPCTMCVGALLHARVERVVYAAAEPRAGALVSQLQLADCDHYNHRLQVSGGLEAEASTTLLRDFFRARRAR